MKTASVTRHFARWWTMVLAVSAANLSACSQRNAGSTADAGRSDRASEAPGDSVAAGGQGGSDASIEGGSGGGEGADVRELSDALDDVAAARDGADADEGGGDVPGAGRCGEPLTFADPAIERAVRVAAQVPDGPLLRADAQRVKSLTIYPPSAPYSGHVQSLAGLECLPALDSFILIDAQAQVTDLSPLSSLGDMQTLLLWGCGGTVDLRPLAALTKLTTLELEQGCGISDVSALFGATGMLQLNFEGNHVSDLSQFLQFPQLTRLFLHRNPIDCVAQRDSLTALRMRKVTVFLDCTN